MSDAGGAAMRLCILGGSTREPGGVESFCERALEAVRTYGDGIVARWVPTDTAYMRPARLPRLLRGLRAFRRAHRDGLDIVWLNVSNLPDLLYLFAAKAYGLPVLATLHLGANSRLQQSPLLRRLCATLLRRADRIALLFDGQEAEIALPDGVPRSTIRTFLPRESFVEPMPHTGDATLHLIHAGRLSEGKGSLAMVELCAALARAGVAFDARIIGRGDDATMQALHARIAATGLADRIALSDWLDGPALLDALRAADGLVHLSRLDSFPLTVLEAMAAGTVPIAIDMAGVRVMMEPYGGHLVAPTRAVEDAATLIVAGTREGLRQSGTAMGARVRADYAWPVCVARLRAALDATRAG